MSSEDHLGGSHFCGDVPSSLNIYFFLPENSISLPRLLVKAPSLNQQSLWRSRLWLKRFIFIIFMNVRLYVWVCAHSAGAREDRTGLGHAELELQAVVQW